MNVRGMKQNCYNIARIACVCGCLVAKACKFTRPVGGNCVLPYLLPEYLWRDFVTCRECCYNVLVGDFATKVPVGGFVTKIPVGGSGNLELLCPKANCFLGGFVGSLHGAMLPSSTCGAQTLNVTGGAQPLKRDGPQKSEQEKTFLAVQIFRAQPLNTRNRLAKCQPSSVHFDAKIRGKSKHSCTCQPVYLPLRKCRSK